MARITEWEFVSSPGGTRHTEVTATCRLVDVDGETYVQIDTFGSADRKLVGKTSQTMQISAGLIEEIARRLP